MPEANPFENLSLEEMLVLRLSWLPYLDYALVAKRLLEHLGFEDVQLSDRMYLRGRTLEGGYDAKGHISLSLGRVSVLAQFKRSQIPVQRRQVDELRATMLRLGVPLGVMVTTGIFSGTATDAARTYPGRPIRLIDGAELGRLLVDSRIGVREERDIASSDLRLTFAEDPFELLMTFAEQCRKRRKDPECRGKGAK